MCSVVNRIKIAGILAASAALVECTGALDGGANGSASGRAPPSLGAAKESLTGGGWKVIGAGDYNFDGMADAIWQNTTTNRIAVWLMSGTKLLLPGPEVPGPADIGP